MHKPKRARGLGSRPLRAAAGGSIIAVDNIILMQPPEPDPVGIIISDLVPGASDAPVGGIAG